MNITYMSISQLKLLNPEFNLLLESIRKEGIITPLIVRDDGMIIDGRQRYLVARILGLDEVPCRIIKCSGEELFEHQRIRTIQVDPVVYAEGLRKLLKYNQLTVEELAEKLGKSVEWVRLHLEE